MDISVKKYYRLIILLTAVLALVGCGTKQLNVEETHDYLKEVYGRSFELISEKTYQRNEYAYLYAGEESNLTKSNIASESIKVDKYKDNDGVEFYVAHMTTSGLFGTDNVVYDDYQMRLLLANTSVAGKLTNSKYNCKVYDEMGFAEAPGAGFILTMNSFDDIKAALTLVYEVIGDDAAHLPSNGYQKSDVKGHSVLPRVIINAPNGSEIGRVSFSDGNTTEKVTLENQIKSCEQKYVELVRNGSIKEQLSDLAYNTYGPNKIMDVTCKGQKIDMMFTRYDGNGSFVNYPETGGDLTYYIYEQCNKTKPLEFPEIAKFAGYMGYEVAPGEGGDNYTLVKGSDKVIFMRTDSSLRAFKNEVELTLRGSFRFVNGTSQIVLTTRDLYEILGMYITIDLKNATIDIQ